MATAGLLIATGPASAHPIHTTLTEIARRADGTIVVRIRAFADDFSAAAARAAGVRPGTGHVVSDATAAGYVSRFVRLEDRHGRVVRLTLAGQRREGDVVWLELRGEASLELPGLRARNAMLFDLHDDQINVVQVAQDGVKRTVLFARGDGMKKLL